MKSHACAFCVRHGLFNRRNCDGGEPVDGKPTRTPRPVDSEAPYEASGWHVWQRTKGAEHMRYRDDLCDAETGSPLPIQHCPALGWLQPEQQEWIRIVGLMLDGHMGDAREWPEFARALFAGVRRERGADDDARHQHREEKQAAR